MCQGLGNIRNHYGGRGSKVSMCQGLGNIRNHYGGRGDSKVSVCQGY